MLYSLYSTVFSVVWLPRSSFAGQKHRARKVHAVRGIMDSTSVLNNPSPGTLLCIHSPCLISQRFNVFEYTYRCTPILTMEWFVHLTCNAQNWPKIVLQFSYMER